jgi:membrane-bound inhibitor of C-type lysozyme|nr:MliC family protein [Candidatus Krumholzibacteria bacterium]
MKTHALLLFCSLILSCWSGAGCDSQKSPATQGARPHPSPEALTCVYESKDGQEFVVRFENQSAWLTLPEGTVVLPLVPAASGAKYSANGLIFWTKGQEATLMREGQPDLSLHEKARRPSSPRANPSERE